MSTMTQFEIIFTLFCLIQAGYCYAEGTRTYCIQISQVNKRDAEIRHVQCYDGFEFCFTSDTCCCEIPEHDNTNLIAAVCASMFVVSILAIGAACCFRCMRLRGRGRYTESSTSTRSIHGYRSKYGSPTSMSSMIYGYRSKDGDGSSIDSYDLGKAGPPLSIISGSLPPPPYSEHSFAVGATRGALVLYNSGEKRGTSSLYGYTKRSSPNSSTASWIKTQDGASHPRSAHSHSHSNRSVARNSPHGSRAGGSLNRAFEPVHDLRTIPSVRSGSGSTKAASEAIYASVARSQGTASSTSKGRRSLAAVAENEMASQAGTHVSAVSYNPASVAATS